MDFYSKNTMAPMEHRFAGKHFVEKSSTGLYLVDVLLLGGYSAVISAAGL
jgi:hypothetical protein